MPRHVLQRREHAVARQRQGGALIPSHRGDSHARYVVGILAVGFLDPAPARIASEIDHGGEHLLGAARPYLTRRYRSEFAMLVVPMAVQRFVFPVLVAIGTLLGRYARYANAPMPITRSAR